MPPHPRLALSGSLSLSPSPSPSPPPGAWTLGEPALDGWLPAGALDPAALHEVKPAAYRDWPAAAGFALRLALRRIRALRQARAGLEAVQREPVILWCWPAALAAEVGWLSARGLATLGLSPSSLLVVAPRRTGDALWALEEGLKSRALALVVGGLPEVALTPARRLSLAAAAGATPCLLVTAPGRAGAAAAATRWRIAACPGAPHPFDADAPGAARFGLGLERCRGATAAFETLSLAVEWCDGAHRFRLAPRMADRAARPGGARPVAEWATEGPPKNRPVAEWATEGPPKNRPRAVVGAARAD